MINSSLSTSSVRRLSVAFLVSLAALASLRAETVPGKKTSEAPAAEASHVAIGAEAGTTGYGPFVVLTLSKHFTANLGYTWFNYDYDFNDGGVDYKGKLKLSNVQAILNYHPFAGTFHLSAGAFISDNKVDVTGQANATGSYTIGDTVYTGTQVGTITGNAKLTKGAVPYVGLGWAKKPTKKGFGCFFDVGVLFMNAPKATLAATGPISSNPTFQDDLRKEETEVNDKLDSFKYYPVVQLGLLYRF